MRLPEDGPIFGPKHVAMNKTNVSSSIVIFLLLCWQSNTTNHDKQQDVNIEDNSRTYPSIYV
jgi:hypothetical protein